MDQGVITNPKINYKRETKRRLIKAYDSEPEHVVSVLTAINMIHQANVTWQPGGLPTASVKVAFSPRSRKNFMMKTLCLVEVA